MTNPFKSLFGLALCAALAPVHVAAEAPRVSQPANVIQGVRVSDVAGGVELEIRGTRAPSYTVFKLQDPPRLVLDLAGADVSAVSVVHARGLRCPGRGLHAGVDVPRLWSLRLPG